MGSRFQRKGTDLDPEADELREEELVLQRGQVLPDRTAMSILDADVAIPVNPALAADVLSGIEDGEADEDDEQESEG